MQCTYCGIPIIQHKWQKFIAATQGLRYGDGRVICTHCHRTAVKHESQLQAVLKHVQNCFFRLGLSVDWAHLPIYLKHQPQMCAFNKNSGTVGYAETTMFNAIIQLLLLYRGLYL